MTNEVTIRIGGESGEGTISGGDILALASARWGYHVYTFRTFPAEILGGPCLFQVRIGDHPVNSMGDYADVLICLNQEAYDRNVSDLRQGGVVIYDPSDFTPDTNNFITYPIPFNEIARKEVQLFQTKNMVLLGAISGLFGPEWAAIIEVVEATLSKSRKANPLLMEKNLLALQVSQKYVTEQISKRDSYRLGPVDKANRVVLNGNQAVVAGALAAQCRYFAGYPITPASDIMEAMAKELPLVGGTFLQAEDEMAALASVLGASFGGLRAMTATSGPGFSLMTELIGLALHAGHGDTPRMIVAPADVADCYTLIIQAFNMAERYQMPVLFLTDQSLTARVESVDRSIFKPMQVEERLQFSANGHSSDARDASVNGHGSAGSVAEMAHSFARYAYTASGISP